jgi:hypothetical protein
MKLTAISLEQALNDCTLSPEQIQAIGDLVAGSNDVIQGILALATEVASGKEDLSIALISAVMAGIHLGMQLHANREPFVSPPGRVTADEVIDRG